MTTFEFPEIKTKKDYHKAKNLFSQFLNTPVELYDILYVEQTIQTPSKPIKFQVPLKMGYGFIETPIGDTLYLVHLWNHPHYSFKVPLISFVQEGEEEAKKHLWNRVYEYFVFNKYSKSKYCGFQDGFILHETNFGLTDYPHSVSITTKENQGIYECIAENFNEIKVSQTSYTTPRLGVRAL